MTLQQKQHEVAARLARALHYDADYSTSWTEELFGVFHRGVRGTEAWNEAELDAYLTHYDADGQALGEGDDAT